MKMTHQGKQFNWESTPSLDSSVSLAYTHPAWLRGKGEKNELPVFPYILIEAVGEGR